MGTRVFLAVKFKMAALLELVKLFSRKKRAEEELLTCQYKINDEMAKKRCQREMEFEMEASEPAVLSAIVQFVTKVVFLVCQDEGKVLQLCFCPWTTSLFRTCISCSRHVVMFGV